MICEGVLCVPKQAMSAGHKELDVVGVADGTNPLLLLQRRLSQSHHLWSGRGREGGADRQEEEEDRLKRGRKGRGIIGLHILPYPSLLSFLPLPPSSPTLFSLLSFPPPSLPPSLLSPPSFPPFLLSSSPSLFFLPPLLPSLPPSSLPCM